MATSSYIQNDTAQVCALNNYCNPSGGTIEAGRQAEQGVSAGASEVTFTVASGQANDMEFSFEVIIPSGSVSEADTAAIPINFTTGSMTAELGTIYLCRVSSGCVNQETIGNLTSIGYATSNGLNTFNVTCSSVTFSAGDKVIITMSFTETGGHSNQTVGITPDQTMSLPFNAAAAGAVIRPAMRPFIHNLVR